MPPKTRFNKQVIINAAYELLEEKGTESLVAREIAKKLGSTTAPLFTSFKNMEELTNEVYLLARDKCEEYLNKAIDYTPSFKEFGLRLYKYASNHPNAYKYIFMMHTPNKKTGELLNIEFIDIIDPMRDEIEKEFGLDKNESWELINQMCVYSMGICSLCVNKARKFTIEELSHGYSKMFVSLVNTYAINNNTFDINKAKVMLSRLNEMPHLKKENK